MNRRQKIIVSVTGIFIVLLILIGLTYAYFLTRITGNGNPTSISVTTANLELVYGDGTTALLTSNTPIEPGKFSSSKDFTVTNNGNALTDYAVTLEDFSITYANDTVINGQQVKAGTVTKMVYPDDMKMTITCVIESDDEDRNGQACGNVNGTLPTENSILLTNSIEVDDIHKYVLTLTYVDSGIDQSADMNKTIKGKIDIIDPKSTIDLSGTVATYQTGDYVEINSTPIKSEIVDGKYKIIGVEPGSHTLNVKYKDTEGNAQTRGSQTLTIQKGDTESVSGNVITFTDASRTATVDIDESYEIIVDEKINGYNPYKEGTLAYNIINNSMLNKNGTELLSKPITTPERGSANMIYTSYTDPISFDFTTEYATSSYLSQWYVYGSEITISKDGYFKIVNPQVGQLSSVISSIKNGYTYPYFGYSSEEEARKKMNDEFFVMYKIGESTTTSKLYYEKVTKVSVTGENILTITPDDYGISYYFRGGVEDNYVNFAGMCWRIVRIAGDGSVKIILEDRYATCDDNETEITPEVYTGNWSDGNTYLFGFGANNIDDFVNYTGGLADSFKTFQTTLAKNINKNLTDESTDLEINSVLAKKLKLDEWCYDNVVTEYQYYNYDYEPVPEPVEGGYITEIYAFSKRLADKKISLKCTGTKLTKFNDNSDMYVATLTADEVTFAASGRGKNYNHYLINNYAKDKMSWWLITPESNSGIDSSAFSYKLNEYGCIDTNAVIDEFTNNYSRPVITLKVGTVITSGEGTQTVPYVVE